MDIGVGPFKVSAQGKDLIIPVIIMAMAALLVTLGWMHHTDSHSDSLKVETRLDEMIYVLSLPQADRDKLNLSMPSSLRARIKPHFRDEDTR